MMLRKSIETDKMGYLALFPHNVKISVIEANLQLASLIFMTIGYEGFRKVE